MPWHCKDFLLTFLLDRAKGHEIVAEYIKNLPKILHLHGRKACFTLPYSILSDIPGRKIEPDIQNLIDDERKVYSQHSEQNARLALWDNSYMNQFSKHCTSMAAFTKPDALCTLSLGLTLQSNHVLVT